jgi:hypothetical protein
MDDDARLFGDLTNWYWYESQDDVKVKEQQERAARWTAIQNSKAFQDQRKEGIEMDRVEAQNAGYQMGSAFLGVFVVKQEAQASTILKLASKFAMWDGYRDLETGQEYMSGFLSAVFDSQPKKIEAEKPQ